MVVFCKCGLIGINKFVYCILMSCGILFFVDWVEISLWLDKSVLEFILIIKCF